MERKQREQEAEEGRGCREKSDRQSEVVFMLAVNGPCKVLVTGLRKTVLLIQNVQDSRQLCFH